VAFESNRRTVAGGVAVGVFFGLLIPVGQILGAAVAAICFKVNLPVAAMSTLVTNPFTAGAPAGYFLVHQTWRWLTVFRLARKRRSRGESA